MRRDFKERNLKLLTRYHQLTLATKKLEKQKQIEIAEEFELTIATVKRVIDKYYDGFLIELGTKNTCLEGLTELRERFKFENLTEKQREYMVQRLFGANDAQATKTAGYKSKGSITKLRRNESIQEFIERERREVLQNTKYTFGYNYNFLGEIAEKTKEPLKERVISEKQGGKNGQELSKTVSERILLGVGVNAIATMNKMAGFNSDDKFKADKLLIEKEKLRLDEKQLEIEKEEKILRANIEVLNLEVLTGNTDIEEEVQGVQEALNNWTEEAWKDEKKTD